MSSAVQTEVTGSVGLIAMASPPVNALGAAMRKDLATALEGMLAEPAVAVIVLSGHGRGFSAGADIREFGTSRAEPHLPDLCTLIEQSPKPVIVVLHGMALGGGLELALAAHLRLSLSDTLLALPEVTLGLLPGAGGTQRLPRLIGCAAAVDLILSGRRITGAEGLNLGLVDRVVTGDLREAGLAAATEVQDGGLVPRQTGTLPVSLDTAVMTAARDRILRRRPALLAPQRALDAIAGCALPLAEGLEAERRLFLELTEGEERQGLVHAFQVERGVHAIPESASASATGAITEVGVIGGGTMGTGIATALLLSGLDVTLVETGADRARAAEAAITHNLADAVDRGRLTVEGQAAAQARLRCTTNFDTLGTADLVIEAVFEDMAVKQDLFRRLDAVCRSGAVLATNTSYLDIAAIAAVTDRPQHVLGLHFFAPAHVMRLLEVVVTDSTAPDVVATGFALARRLGKIPVRSGVCDGFIGNRILAQCRKVADHMLMDGVDFAQIDRALEDAGFALGPYATADLSGLDIGYAMRQRRAASRPAAERYCRVGDRLCEAGALGRKAGRGYYLYEGSAARKPNPEAEEIVAAERWASGVVTRPFSDEEIVARYLAAMICEAARILDEGIALCAGDIDAVLLFGYGFPRHLGGPMHMADRIGAARLAEHVRAYAEEDAQFWRMPALLARLAATGGGFANVEGDNRDGF